MIQKSFLATTVSAFVLIAASSANACIGEAQVIANVQSVQPLDQSFCVATLSADSFSQYSVNQICPLFESEVLEKGFKVRNHSEGVCSVHPGDLISGVIVEAEDGSLTLEQN